MSFTHHLQCDAPSSPPHPHPPPPIYKGAVQIKNGTACVLPNPTYPFIHGYKTTLLGVFQD